MSADCDVQTGPFDVVHTIFPWRRLARKTRTKNTHTTTSNTHIKVTLMHGRARVATPQSAGVESVCLASRTQYKLIRRTAATQIYLRISHAFNIILITSRRERESAPGKTRRRRRRARKTRRQEINLNKYGHAEHARLRRACCDCYIIQMCGRCARQ